MKIVKIIFLIVCGLLCGAVVGTALAIGGTLALGLLMQWLHPNDPTAGSVTVISIGTVPGGCLYGAWVGAKLAAQSIGKLH